MKEAEQKTTHFGYKTVATSDKVNHVADVFHSVAAKYDLMNDLLSFGIHRLWKRVTIASSGARKVNRFWKKVSSELRRGKLTRNIYIEFRISVEQGWWMKLRKINAVLAKHDSIYEKEALDPSTFEIKYLNNQNIK